MEGTQDRLTQATLGINGFGSLGRAVLIAAAEHTSGLRGDKTWEIILNTSCTAEEIKRALEPTDEERKITLKNGNIIIKTNNENGGELTVKVVNWPTQDSLEWNGIDVIDTLGTSEGSSSSHIKGRAQRVLKVHPGAYINRFEGMGRLETPIIPGVTKYAGMNGALAFALPDPVTLAAEGVIKAIKSADGETLKYLGRIETRTSKQAPINSETSPVALQLGAIFPEMLELSQEGSGRCCNMRQSLNSLPIGCDIPFELLVEIKKANADHVKNALESKHMAPDRIQEAEDGADFSQMCFNLTCNTTASERGEVSLRAMEILRPVID